VRPTLLIRSALALAALLGGCTTWQPVEGPDGDPGHGDWPADRTYRLELEGGEKIQARRLQLEGERIRAEVRSDERHSNQYRDWPEETIPLSSIVRIEEKRTNTGLTIAAIATADVTVRVAADWRSRLCT
jgi:hypothetical protein